MMNQCIQPFTQACKKVFKTLIDLEITPEHSYLFDKNAVHTQNMSKEWDISAVIGLAGDARGAVVISMKKELAFRLTGILTGKTHTNLDDDVRDAMGEIINIITGNAKQGLETVFKLVVSLPTIIKGDEHSISWPGSGVHAQIVCIPFTIFENYEFILSVSLARIKAASFINRAL